MATELAHAYVTIIPSLKGAGKTIEKALGGIDTTSTGKSWGRSLAGGMVSTAATGVKAIGAIGLAVGGLALSGGISRALKLEEAQYKFKAMGIDAEKALESCNEAVSGTAYGLDAAAAIAAQLGTAGVEAGNQMTQALKAAAGMAAMGGVELERVGLVFSKVAATGRLQGDELMQFTEMGVNATAALAKHLGKTQSEIREMVSAGEIDFQTFADAMYATFGEAAKGANETFSGAMSNVRAALSRIGAKFATPALEGLRRLFVALIPAINAVSKVLDPLVEVFTKFTDKVTDRAVAGIEAFTEALTNTGSFLSAFKWLLDAAFEGTPIGTIIGKINGFTGAVRAGTSPVALLKAYWAEFTAFIKSGTSSAIENLREKIATLPAPIQNIISALSGFGSKVAEVFGNINIGGAAAIAGFAGILAKFGAPLTTVVTKLFTFGATIKTIFANVGGMSAFLLTKLGALKTAFMAFLTPVNLVVVGIAALAAAFAYLMTTNESFRNTVMALVGTIGASLSPIITIVGQALGNLASTVLPLITNLVAMLVPVLGQIVVVILQVVAAIAPVVTALVGTVVPILTTIIQLVVAVATQIIAAVIPCISMILGIIQTAMPLIQTIITTVCGAVLGIVNMVWPLVQKIINTVVKVVLSFMQSAMPVIQAVFESAMKVILAVVESVWPVIEAIIETAMNVIQSVIQIVTGIISNDWTQVWEGIKNLASSVWDGVKNIVTTGANAIKEVVTAVLNGIKAVWNSIWSWVKSFISSVWNSVKSAVSNGVSNVISFVTQLPSKIKSLFSNAGSLLVSAGGNILQGLWNGISNKVSWLLGKVGGIGGSILSAAKKALGIASPSKLFRDEVGEWIPAGVGVGIEKNMGSALSAMRTFNDALMDESVDIAPFEDMSASVSTSRIIDFGDSSSLLDYEYLAAAVASALEKADITARTYINGNKLISETANESDRSSGLRQIIADRGVALC